MKKVRQQDSENDCGGLDPLRIRMDFPILNTTLDGRPLIYLDNAATTQMPESVIAEFCDYYHTSCASVHRGIHFLTQKSTLLYEGARQTVADFIGAASPREVIFTHGTTESINLAASGWASRHLKAGDRILVTAMEHHSNLIPWQRICNRNGAVLQWVPVNDDGTLDEEILERLLRPGVKLLAVTHVSNVLGTVNPIRELAQRAHAIGALLIVDGAQSVPHMPIDVKDLDCDFFAFSGHKMCAPMGIGVLYGRLELLESMEPFMSGGEMVKEVDIHDYSWADPPYRFEAGTPNVSGAVGLAAAIRYLGNIGMHLVQAHDHFLTRILVEQLGSEKGVRVVGAAKCRGAAVSFVVDGIHPHDLSHFANQHGVAIRAGRLCAQPLLKCMGLDSVCRASPYIYNTGEDFEPLIEAIREARKVFLP